MRDCLSDEVRDNSQNGHHPPPLAMLGVDAISVLDYIGNTPLFKFCSITRHLQNVEVYGKAEYLNPGGSVKDRLADAYATHLIQVDVEDLPESLRDDFECLCQAMRREQPLPRESAIRASVRKMSNEEAARHARASGGRVFGGGCCWPKDASATW